jgi:3-oxoacyl-[acyl-carrier protein] reductase
MTGLEGRVALVTGATGGIGRALVARLQVAGLTVVATTRRAEGAGLPDGVDVVEADMRHGDALPGLVQGVRERHGSLDVLVPNAGTGERRSLEETSREDWDAALAVNLTAPFLLAQAAVPAMAARGFGRVLLVSSVAAFTGGAIGPHYAASKAGLQGLVGFLSSRYASRGVTVNAIAPAAIGGTGMGDALPPETVASIPVGRAGRPAEVADLALAMLEGGYLTGKTVLLDGGMLSR